MFKESKVLVPLLVVIIIFGSVGGGILIQVLSEKIDFHVEIAQERSGLADSKMSFIQQSSAEQIKQLERKQEGDKRQITILRNELLF